LAQNQLEVKNFFKALGLTKLQTAAIMGNIHYESGYDIFKISRKIGSL
jgi:hypothetical protein